ncbi:hypothetical protein F511_43126 [Dorcoceras hygrometricum]|uniref:Retroviral polymerase SH3-like domain-containing protein n=1 Tax=Dorcoceras hygrometricum TaxID=472368 RepID=A0A2Z7A639_9LAMI|nr:hypothetical protein F511_43126 [Dorcoceras hygrometricum]
MSASTKLPLKTFGCTAFVHVHDHHRSKLDPRAIKTVFLCYSSTQKGYCCYCPIIKKAFISRDVSFFESTPYFLHPRPLERIQTLQSGGIQHLFSMLT